MRIPIPEFTPPYGERLVVIKKGESVALPYQFTLEDSNNIKWRVEDEQRGFAHGGVSYGDRKVKSKKIKISIDIRGDTEEEYNRYFNDLLSLLSGKDYSLCCGRTDRVYRVDSLVEVKSKYRAGFKQRWSEVDLTFLLTDPFRYAANATAVNFDFTKEAQEQGLIEFNNPSSVDVPLIWTFTPLIDAPVMSILITHEQTGQSFTLKDALLNHPARAVVNAETGTVRRNEDNSLNTFSGLFLHAEPGRNVFRYTGGKVLISVQYTARWLV